MEIKTKKGFTLIELLIVIGILAILSSAVVIVLNPGQLLAQARDTQRISDLATLNSSISYYLATTSKNSGTTFMSKDIPGPPVAKCGSNYWATIAGAVNPFINATDVLVALSATPRAVNNSGWVPIDLTTSSGGTTLGSLPSDPTNSTTFYYAYSCNEVNKQFEIDAMLESTKYMPKGWNTADGGDAIIGNNVQADALGFSVYETGSSVTL